MTSRYLRAVLTAIISIIIFTFMCIGASARLYGDVDGNGLAADDARNALRCAVGLQTYEAPQKDILDVDKDGKVTAADARLILRMTVNLTPPAHYFEPVIITAPTCTNAGKQKRVCTECNICASFEEDIPALGHDFENGKHEIIKPATCTETGLQKVTCVRGDITEEQTIPITHKFTQASCTQASICTVCGKENTPALGHTTRIGVCERCGVYIDTLQKEADTVKAAINTAISKNSEAYAKLNEIPAIDTKDGKITAYTAARHCYTEALNAYVTVYNLSCNIPEFKSAGINAQKIYNLINEILADDKKDINLNNERDILIAIDALQFRIDEYNSTLKNLINSWTK